MLDQSWKEHYTNTSHWCDFWDQTHGSRGSWPPHVRLFGDKMYFEGRLCVPENLVFNVLAAHHEAMGHLGANRLVTEAQRRYALPPSVALTPERGRSGAHVQSAKHVNPLSLIHPHIYE